MSEIEDLRYKAYECFFKDINQFRSYDKQLYRASGINWYHLSEYERELLDVIEPELTDAYKSFRDQFDAIKDIKHEAYEWSDEDYYPDDKTSGSGNIRIIFSKDRHGINKDKASFLKILQKNEDIFLESESLDEFAQRFDEETDHKTYGRIRKNHTPVVSGLWENYEQEIGDETYLDWKQRGNMAITEMEDLCETLYPQIKHMMKRRFTDDDSNTFSDDPPSYAA